MGIRAFKGNRHIVTVLSSGSQQARFQAPAAPLTELAAAGDLCAVDRNNGVYYYLGDTASGTTLVGVDTATGAKLCSQPVPALKELGFVGIG